MSKKQKIILLFSLFCSFWSKAEQDIHFNVSNIPIVFKVDSLENYIRFRPQLNIKQYLRDLIIIEKNNYHIRYEKSGDRLLEIFCLSTLLKEERALALYNYYHSAFYHTNAKNYDGVEAYEQLFIALQQFKRLNDTLGISMCHRLIISFYVTNEKQIVKDQIKECIIDVENILKSTHDINVKLFLLETKAKIYESNKQWHDYQIVVNEIIKLLELRKDTLFYRPTFFINISWISFLNNDFEKAYQYLLKAKTEKMGNFENLVFNLNLGEILLKKKKYSEAKKKFELANQIIRSFPNEYYYLYAELYSYYSECLADMGDFKMALNFRDSVQYYNQKQTHKTKNNDIESYIYAAKKESNQKEIEFLKKESSLFQVIIVMLLLGILITILFYIRIRMLKTRLEKLNTFLLRLITVISHDIRSPLLATNGLTELVKGVLDKKRYEQFPQIILSIEKTNLEVLNLINNILSWISLYNTNSNLKIQTVNIENLLDELRLLYNNQAQLYLTELKIDVDKSLEIKTNRDALAIILRNAIDNAIKHSQKMPIEIKAHIENGYCVLNIKNSEVIQMQNIKKILNALAQKNVIDKYSVGFGIELMSFFATQINAKIDIEIVKDVGTIVKVFIPLK